MFESPHVRRTLRLPRTLRVALLVAPPALVAPNPSLAAFHLWTGVSPRARSVEAVVRDPLLGSRLWAASFGAGVFRSDDGGLTWTAHRTGLVNTYVRCLAVEPSHPDSVYCGTNDGVYLSVDGGLTWSRLLSTPHSVRAISIHPIRTGVLYAATNGDGIFKSLNAGKNWSTIDLGLVNTSVRDVALHPVSPDTLFAATGTGGGVHVSFNGGLTWAQVADTAASKGAVEQIQFDRLDPRWIYAATLDRGVLRSVDGGVHWLRINRGLTSFRTRALAIVDTLRYVGTDGAGVFVTTLNDTSWHPAATLPAPVVDALLATGRDSVWAGTDGGGIARTADRGAHWTPLDGGLLDTYGFSLAVRPSTHEAYAGLGFGDQTWRSADGGVTWTRASFLFTRDSEHGIAPDPVLSTTVYLSAYGSGVYRSDDDGVTWSRPDSVHTTPTLGNPFVRELVAVPGEAGHLFVGSGDGVFESTDGAQSWTARRGGLPAGLSVRSLALVPGNPPTLYAGSDSSGVWRSADGGASWTAGGPGIPVPFIHGLLVDAASPLTVYAATDSGVYRSVDGAASWAPARVGLPAASGARALVQDGVHGALFCGTAGGGVFESLDGGGSWKPVFGNLGLMNLDVRSLAIDPATLTLFAGTDVGVGVVTGYATTIGVASADGPEPPLALSLRAWPDPAASGDVSLRFTLPREADVALEVFDVSGARVRTVSRGATSPGTHVVRWDLRDGAGARVRPGLYFVRLDDRRESRVARLVVTGSQ